MLAFSCSYKTKLISHELRITVRQLLFHIIKMIPNHNDADFQMRRTLRYRVPKYSNYFLRKKASQNKTLILNEAYN
jgi:hypothetical protein